MNSVTKPLEKKKEISTLMVKFIIIKYTLKNFLLFWEKSIVINS
jgi:hypothetical protein